MTDDHSPPGGIALTASQSLQDFMSGMELAEKARLTPGSVGPGSKQFQEAPQDTSGEAPTTDAKATEA